MPRWCLYCSTALALSLSCTTVYKEGDGLWSEDDVVFSVCNCSFYKALIPDFTSDKALSKDWALGRKVGFSLDLFIVSSVKATDFNLNKGFLVVI